MTLSDQLTAALRLECAVADGTVELQRGAGPGGVDLYVYKKLPPRTPLRPPVKEKA